MNIEHIALNVADPAALADWYVRHLGLRVVRQADAPVVARFLADASGKTVLEIYRQDAPVPDYARMDPLTLHIAFTAPDIHQTRAQLLAAGATAVGDVTTAPNSDELAMLRDPWGMAIQLVKRARPLVSS
ncbi:MAG: VOC family protein [Gemmataceae bacterium]